MPRALTLAEASGSAAGPIADIAMVRRRCSRLHRWRGLRHQPIEVALIDALDRNDQDRGRGVGMHFLDRGAHALRERGAGLDDHHDLLTALERALPPIMRDHAGQDVDARAETALDQRAAGLLRLDNRGPG